MASSESRGRLMRSDRWARNLACAFGNWAVINPASLEWKSAVIDLPGLEYVGSAELMEELMEFTTVSPRVDV